MSNFPESPPGKWTNYNVAQGLLVYERKVLLVGNDYGGPDLTWSLPGGRLEPGEQHPQAVVREVREETGLEVVAGDLLFVMDARNPHDRRHFITCVFEVWLANPSEGEPAVTSGDDVAVKMVRWVPFEDVPGLMVRPSLGEGLVNYLYYGPNQMPRRYWHYPDYAGSDWQPLTWPPRTE